MTRFRVGDKVIPVSKSTGCSFESSTVIERMNDREEKYLVINEIKNNGIHVCEGDWFLEGDLFLERDLIPYEENNESGETGMFDVGTVVRVINNVNEHRIGDICTITAYTNYPSSFDYEVRNNRTGVGFIKHENVELVIETMEDSPQFQINDVVKIVRSGCGIGTEAVERWKDEFWKITEHYERIEIKERWVIKKLTGDRQGLELTMSEDTLERVFRIGDKVQVIKEGHELNQDWIDRYNDKEFKIVSVDNNGDIVIRSNVSSTWLVYPYQLEKIEENITPVEKMCTCCGKTIEVGESYQNTSDGVVCISCRNEKYERCEDCNKWHKKETIRHLDNLNRHVCSSCLSRNYTQCSDCGEWIKTSNSYMTTNDERICSDCVVNYTRCYCCDYYELEENIKTDRHGRKYCPSCVDDGEGDFDFDKEFIKEYNYKPTPEFQGTSKTGEFFGIELEIDKGGELGEHARKVTEMLPWVYCKHDGSLNKGFEIVTHPCSYKFHMDNKKLYKKAFNYLVSNNYKSHDTETCGLHIHVSKKAFGEGVEQELNIAKLLYLVEVHFEKLEKLSRRKRSNLQQWANNKGVRDGEHALNVLDKYKHDCERYVAVNLRNKHTVEFRIFRGTLNIDTFMATLQLVKTMVNKACKLDITKLQNVSWEDFSYSKYADLKRYIEKHFPTQPQEIKEPEINLTELQKDRDLNGYRVGDVVQLKDDFTNLLCFNGQPEKAKLQGQIYTIKGIDSDTEIYFEERETNRWTFYTSYISQLIKPAKEEETNTLAMVGEI